MFTPAQLRAARALINWSRGDLAKASKMSVMAVKSFENGLSDPRVSTLVAIKAALAKAGVGFLDPADGHDGGVVLLRRKPGK